MSQPYLTLATFRARTLMSVAEVDYVEADSPGFVASRIAIRTAWLHARLRKRYGASIPFGTSDDDTNGIRLETPESILGWLVALVTYDVMRKRGLNPQDPAGEQYRADAEKAEAEVKEAADSKDGLFDLPSSNADDDSNVTTGGPQGYSEASPYTWTNLQGCEGKAEDAQTRRTR